MKQTKQRPILVCLADIVVAYRALFDAPMPSDMAFATAGELVRKARPADWNRVFSLAQERRGNGTDYAAAALAVRADLGLDDL